MQLTMPNVLPRSQPYLPWTASVCYRGRTWTDSASQMSEEWHLPMQGSAVHSCRQCQVRREATSNPHSTVTYVYIYICSRTQDTYNHTYHKDEQHWGNKGNYGSLVWRQPAATESTRYTLNSSCLLSNENNYIALTFIALQPTQVSHFPCL